jgi:hypothetical protein
MVPVTGLNGNALPCPGDRRDPAMMMSDAVVAAAREVQHKHTVSSTRHRCGL